MATFGRTVVTKPTEFPVTLAEVCDWLDLDQQTADARAARIDSYIETATEVSEHYLQRQFVTATWDLFCDDFPSGGRTPFEAALPPLQSITSVKYYDTAGTQQTWASSNYTVSTDTEPGKIEPNTDTFWPEAQNRVDAVEIRAVVGYGGSGDVPEAIKTAIKTLVRMYYDGDCMAGELPDGVKSLLDVEAWTICHG